MTGWLLDTNIISELRRPRPAQRVVAFVAAQPLESLHISAVTLAEIRFGIELVADAGRRAELSDWLTHKVRPMFAQRVLPVSEDIMFKWRLLVEEGLPPTLPAVTTTFWLPAEFFAVTPTTSRWPASAAATL